ncbi:Right handed beta helix region [Planctomycetales bacterium 10988]|nr:Right handed beta helix region [Planctomycetales bacterium 10988]
MKTTFRISPWLLVLLFLPLLGILGFQMQNTIPNTQSALVGDGEADDTAALQSLIDSAEGAIELPRGIYRITKPLLIDLDQIGVTSLSGGGVATLKMDGPGPAIRLRGTHFKSAAPRTFEERVWQRQRMPLIDGLAIIGDHPEADGIEAAGTMQLTMTRLHIKGVRHGIHLIENNRNIIISDCHLYENQGCGLLLDDVNLHQINVNGCHISYNAGGGIVSRKGNVRNLHITGCDLESNMSDATEPTANVLIDCRESEHGTGEVAITGCTIQHNSTSPDSANIRIMGQTQLAKTQAFQQEGNVTITGNVFSDVRVNVHLDNCRGVTLTGNTFWMGYEHDLLIENSSNIVIGPNNLDRNPRYNYGTTQDANNGVLIQHCEDCTIQGLHITRVWRKEAALILRNCRRMHLANCTLLDNDNCGVLLEGVTQSRIEGLFIRDDRPETTSVPFKMIDSQRNKIERALEERIDRLEVKSD